MPGPDRSKKATASKDRSRTPSRGPPPKAVPPASKAVYVGAPRGDVLRKAAASAPGPGAPGSRRWAGALPRCRCSPCTGDCQYPWCPLRRDPPPDAPGAAASAAPGAGVPKDGVPWAKPLGWAGLASAAPGGSIPQTPAPTPSQPPSSSQTTTTTTNEFLADGEMVTIVTTRTTIITRAPGVDGSKESEASSSKD